MKDCCEVTADYTARQRRVLRVVLWISIVMFLVGVTAGLRAHSTALLADSVDMLGDAIVYGFSLYVVARGAVWQDPLHVPRCSRSCMPAKQRRASSHALASPTLPGRVDSRTRELTGPINSW